MLHHIGIALQFFVLVFLPGLIIWQLSLGFDLLVMPTCLIGGIIVFGIGTKLREMK